MKIRLALNLLLILLFFSINNILGGIGDYEKHKIFASDGADYNYFGSQGSIAIDGDYAVVGSYYADVNGINNAGAAYIYFWNGTNWDEQAKLIASNAGEEQHFGKSVSISGDRVVIGAIGTYSTNSLGQAYVFKRNGTSWTQESILTASDGTNRDAFGTDVQILNDEVIISANDQYSYKGAVYYFKFDGTNWVETQIISPTSTSGYKQFGKSFKFDENSLLIGCIDDSFSGFRMPGAVYAFAKEGGLWVQKTRILPDDNTIRVSFGQTVTLENNIAVVSDVDSTPEKVYIFFKTNDTTWTQIDTLKSGSSTNDMFGYEIAIDNEYILVGSMENSAAAYEAGCVFVYKKNAETWTLDEKILPSDSESMGNFGNSVACSNGRYIIGASWTSGNTSYSGAAFIYMSPAITPGVITSTANGGNWWDASTWIGEVVPAATDDVIIDGLVKANWNINSYSMECKNLTINSEKNLYSDDMGSYGVSVDVFGEVTNNGTISQSRDDGYNLVLSIAGSAINNSVWKNSIVLMNGTSDQTFTNNGLLYSNFEFKANVESATTFQWYKNGTPINEATQEKYVYTRPLDTLAYDVYGEYYCQTNAGNSRKIKISKSEPISDAIVSTTAGGDWHLTSTWIGGIIPTKNDDVVIDGLVKANSNQYLYARECKNLTINKNKSLYVDNFGYYGEGVEVFGDVSNNGTISQSRSDGWEFTLSISGNVTNNSVWSNSHVIMNGTMEQTFTNNGLLYSNFILQAKVESATTFQWYKNGSPVTGGFQETLVIYRPVDTLTFDVYGTYYCQTNAGNSRTIIINKGGNIEGGAILSENFNGTQFPPNGWTQTILNSAKTWVNSNPEDNPFTVDPENVYSAICPWVAANQDEWLITPIFTLPDDAISLEFYAGHSTNWLSSATLKLNISTDGGSNWTKIWEAENDGNGWTWRKISLDLSSYGNNSNVMLAWQYVGNDGDLGGIDNVYLTYGTVEVEKTILEIPTKYVLNQNYPNPFNPSTIISYQLPKQGFVTLNIYNILGQKVASLVNEEQNAGNYQFNFDASKLSTGTYIYQIQSGNFIQARKMLLIK